MVKVLCSNQSNRILQILQSNEIYVEVDSIPPEPEQKIGKNNVAYYNPEKKAIEWRQEDRPLTLEEQLSKLSKEQETTSQAVQELVLSSMGGA